MTTSSKRVRRYPARDEGGFSLIELLVVMGLLAILLTLGVFALRTLWMNRALSGGQNSIVAQFRQLQQQTISENHPVVLGAAFDPGRAEYKIVRFNATTQNCTLTRTVPLDGPGVTISSVDFDNYGTQGNAPQFTNVCKSAAGYGGGAAVAFFFARGTATEGQVTLRQAEVNKTAGVCVAGITGRVTTC